MAVAEGYMYFGASFGPVSLLGLLFRGSTMASTIAHPAITVIVPVRNGEKTIEKCIRSIEDQRGVLLELIVIDDSSTDMTSTLLGKLSAKYRNIKILRNTKNMGKAVSVNNTLEGVQTPLTAIVDADTVLGKDYLFEVSKTFHKQDIVGASGIVLPSEARNTVEKSRLVEYLHGQFTYKTLQEKLGTLFVCAGCCSVWRTEWLRENKIPRETVVEDLDLTWEAQIKGKKIAFTPMVFAYTDEPDTLSKYTKQLERWFSWRPVLKKHSKNLTFGLKIVIMWMLAESVGYLVWLGVILYLILTGQVFTSFIMLLFDIAVITLVSTWQGRKLGISLKKVASSIPRYYFLRIPTVFLFWKAFIKPKRAGW
jgi:cellulose synthase/poly-beta-1,6-N-acetylglucosamine synthase-like glycosyltransferase